jgi:hypothetical protein
LLQFTKQGVDDTSTLSKGAAANLYSAFLKMRTKLVREGHRLEELTVYVAPEVIEAVMNDTHYISNGQSVIQSQEVRYGFGGTFLSFYLVEVPRMGIVPLASAKGNNPNIFFVDERQAFKIRHLVSPLRMEKAPTDRIEQLFLQGLERYCIAIINKGDDNNDVVGQQGASVHYLEFNPASVNP